MSSCVTFSTTTAFGFVKDNIDKNFIFSANKRELKLMVWFGFGSCSSARTEKGHVI